MSCSNWPDKFFRAIRGCCSASIGSTHINGHVQGVRQTQLANIFSAPLEIANAAKKKIDSAIGQDAADAEDAADGDFGSASELRVASTPCLHGSTDTECTKHWAAHYMARAHEAIEGLSGL